MTVYEKRRDRGSEKRRVRAKDVFVHRRSTVLVTRDRDRRNTVIVARVRA